MLPMGFSQRINGFKPNRSLWRSHVDINYETWYNYIRYILYIYIYIYIYKYVYIYMYVYIHIYEGNVKTQPGNQNGDTPRFFHFSMCATRHFECPQQHDTWDSMGSTWKWEISPRTDQKRGQKMVPSGIFDGIYSDLMGSYSDTMRY